MRTTNYVRTKKKMKLMHAAILFVLCYSGIVTGQLPVKFLPTEYSSINPYQFEINRNSVALELPLCSTTHYIGCTATLEFNLPFTEWSIPDGTYLNFTALGIGDNCATVLCRNDPNSPTMPGICSFVFQKDVGDRIYVVGVSGRAAGFQATFNMKIVCPAEGSETSKASAYVYKDKSNLAQCPLKADPTKRFITLVTPGSVKTSPKTTDATEYAVLVCPDQMASSSITYNCQAVDQKSAMATYFCPSENCNTNTSPQGWFDQSGTALNFVEINSLASQVLYFTIYGWGEYQQVNTFVFNLEINDK